MEEVFGTEGDEETGVPGGEEMAGAERETGREGGESWENAAPGERTSEGGGQTAGGRKGRSRVLRRRAATRDQAASRLTTCPQSESEDESFVANEKKPAEADENVAAAELVSEEEAAAFEQVSQATRDTALDEEEPGPNPFRQLRSSPLVDIWAKIPGCVVDWGEVHQCVVPLQFRSERGWSSSTSREGPPPPSTSTKGEERRGRPPPPSTGFPSKEKTTTPDVVSLRHRLSQLISPGVGHTVLFTRNALPVSPPPPCPTATMPGATLAPSPASPKPATLFDTSYRRVLRFSGRDREMLADHFLTTRLSKLRVGDAAFCCVVDSRASVLDLAFVLKSPDEIVLLTEGADFLQLRNYLADYVAYSRQSGLECAMSSEWLGAEGSVELCGAGAAEALAGGFAGGFAELSGWDCGEDLIKQGAETTEAGAVDEPFNTRHNNWRIAAPAGFGHSSEDSARNPGLEALRDPDFWRNLPKNGCVKLVADGNEDFLFVLKNSFTGEPGFILFGSMLKKQIWRMLMAGGQTTQDALRGDPYQLLLGGYSAYEVLRLEAGHPAPGQDVKPGMWSPVRNSLASTIDGSKLRLHTLFGCRNAVGGVFLANEFGLGGGWWRPMNFSQVTTFQVSHLVQALATQRLDKMGNLACGPLCEIRWRPARNSLASPVLEIEAAHAVRL